jgi:hypothetical protein
VRRALPADLLPGELGTPAAAGAGRPAAACLQPGERLRPAVSFTPRPSDRGGGHTSAAGRGNEVTTIPTPTPLAVVDFTPP